MQDQVNEKVVAVSVRTTKLTALVLQAAIKQVLVKMKALTTLKYLREHKIIHAIDRYYIIFTTYIHLLYTCHFCILNLMNYNLLLSA